MTPFLIWVGSAVDAVSYESAIELKEKINHIDNGVFVVYESPDVWSKHSNKENRASICKFNFVYNCWGSMDCSANNRLGKDGR